LKRQHHGINYLPASIPCCLRNKLLTETLLPTVAISFYLCGTPVENRLLVPSGSGSLPTRVHL